MLITRQYFICVAAIVLLAAKLMKKPERPVSVWNLQGCFQTYQVRESSAVLAEITNLLDFAGAISERNIGA